MKKINNIIYSNSKQAVLPMLIQDYLDICDPVLTFDRFMGEIELEKYLKNIPQHDTGRLRYDPVSMLKTVLFGFMENGYISLRELEEQCKVNLRFMYLIFSLSVLIFSLIARHLYKIDHTVSTNNITSWSCIYFLFTYWTIILYRFII